MGIFDFGKKKGRNGTVAMPSKEACDPALGAEELFSRGRKADDNGDYAAALSFYRAAAEQGHARAQFLLGEIYQAQDEQEHKEQAAIRYRMAAVQGHAEGQYRLGLCYRNGTGVEKDEAEAFRWLLAAAENGKALAMWMVSNEYLYGTVVERNPTERKRWMDAYYVATYAAREEG